MNTYELIDAAADLLARSGFSQGANARDDTGRPVFVLGMAGIPEATCFCAHGALCRATDDAPKWASYAEQQTVKDAAFDALNKLSPDHSLVKFNDTKGRKKEEVVALMRSTADTLRTLNQGH